MKQVEKLDLLLKALYQHRNEGYYPLTDLCLENNLSIDITEELEKLAKRLQSESFIDTLFASDEYFVQITAQGIEYCFRDSFASKGKPLVTVG